MFQFQIDQMKGTVKRLLDGVRTPERVGIKREHAEYLGVPFATSQPINEVHSSGMEIGLMYGSVVMVKLIDLYTALEEANGVDRKNETKGSGQTSPARSEESTPEQPSAGGEAEASNSDQHEECEAGETGDGG